MKLFRLFRQRNDAHGFTPFVRDMAGQSLTSVYYNLPTVTKATHPYAVARGIDLRRTPDGWGVMASRQPANALAELLISRLAVHADVPVAPTFLTEKQREQYGMISFIPFASIIQSPDIPLERMPGYLRHYASTLPFMLWLGNDMDRDQRNICRNAQDPALFADFDFDATSVAHIFGTRDLKPYDKNGNQTYRWGRVFQLMTNESPADALAFRSQRPILRSAFKAAVGRIADIPERQLERSIAMLVSAITMPPHTLQIARLYLIRRRQLLIEAFTRGDFEPYMADKLPRETDTAPQIIAASTFRFK